MPRKLTPEMTLDTLEDELLFTAAGLEADEDARDLVPETADWLPQVDAVRVTDRAVRKAVATVDATRMVANERLDIEVLAFSDTLLADVDKDRTSSRWLGFFSVAPSRFIRQPLADETATVQGWLEASTDPALEEHRLDLTKRSGNAQAALVSTKGLPARRSTLHQQREDLVASLTASRDALCEKLAARARERKLPRSWADAFFRTE